MKIFILLTLSLALHNIHAQIALPEGREQIRVQRDDASTGSTVYRSGDQRWRIQPDDRSDGATVIKVDRNTYRVIPDDGGEATTVRRVNPPVEPKR